MKTRGEIKLYTTQETAELLRMSVRNLQRIIKKGELVPTVIGERNHVFPHEELERYIQAQRKQYRSTRED